MLRDKKPLISVIMGVRYRRDSLDLLERSVVSILNQSCVNFEFLICDGGSTRAASELLNRFAEEDSRIRLVREAGGSTNLAHKLNACLRCARGEFIARMDDDDCSWPERFERQINYLNTYSDIAFVGCNVHLIRDGGAVGARIFPERPVVRDFYMTQPFIHPALMFRKEALLAIRGYSEGKHQVLCEDYDLLLRLYATGYRGANLQESLLDYTVPVTAKGNRKMNHRWNEVVTRWRRFRQLHLLPGALPYVVKPLAVGLLPESLLAKMKK